MLSILVCLGLLFVGQGFAQSTCSASSPCPAGCCSKFGNCGYGPDFCAKDNCINSCDVKADCDPGSWGSDYVELDHCPLNVCCSKHGFCGTTEEFCGDNKPTQPSCPVDRSKGFQRVVGYYESWSRERPCNSFMPEQIPIGVYTHLNYAFAGIDPNTFELVPSSIYDKGLYRRLADLKLADPSLKVMIAIGGWSFNDPGPTATVFSTLARDTGAQEKFIASIGSFMATYDFDGVDLDWEYPGAPDRSGTSEDFTNFPKFMKTLRRAIRGHELSITLPASFWYLQHFDIKTLQSSVDWFNMMTYDFHGVWDKPNKWVGPYLNSHTNLTEIEMGLDLLWRNDVKPEKVVMGLAFYGRGFTATSPSCMNPGCTFESGSPAMRCSREVSVLLNSEIDELVKSKGLRPIFDTKAAVKILKYDDNKWATFDDEATLLKKADFARSKCLGGLMVWAVSHDTADAKYSQILGKVAGRKFANLQKEGDGTVNIEHWKLQCKWSGCGEECPANWIRVKREGPDADGTTLMQDNSGCVDGQGPHTFCCPPDQKPPTCGWYNHNNGNCDRNCPDGFTEIGSNSRYCNNKMFYNFRSGQAACCSTDVESMQLYKPCQWGKEDGCRFQTCDKEVVAASFSGSGGAICDEMSSAQQKGDGVTLGLPGNSLAYDDWKRKWCCDQRDENAKWSDCVWMENNSGVCNSQCPPDKPRVAMDETFCTGGTSRARCCTANLKTIESVVNLTPKADMYSQVLEMFFENPVCYDPSFFSMTNTIFTSNMSAMSSASPARMISSFNNTQLVARDGKPVPKDKMEIAIEFIYILFWTLQKADITLQTLWNDYGLRLFPKASYLEIWEYIHKPKVGLFYTHIYGAGREAATMMACNFYDFYDKLSGSGGSETAVCACTREDCCLDGDANCIEHPGPERLALTSPRKDSITLRKRAHSEPSTVIWGPDYDVIIFNWPDHPGGETQWIPNPNDPTAISVLQNSWTFDPLCGVLRPAREDLVSTMQQNGRLPFRQTEHGFERVNFIEMVQAGLNGLLAPRDAARPDDDPFLWHGVQHQVPPRFWLESMQLNNGRPTTPLYRMMQAIGSNQNRGVFALVIQALNLIKSALWSRSGNLHNAVEMDAWSHGSDSRPPTVQGVQSAIYALERVVQTYNWHFEPDNAQHLRTSIRDMRQALEDGEEHYRTNFGAEAYASNHFQAWVNSHFAGMRAGLLDFGQRILENIRESAPDAVQSHHSVSNRILVLEALLGRRQVRTRSGNTLPAVDPSLQYIWRGE